MSRFHFGVGHGPDRWAIVGAEIMETAKEWPDEQSYPLQGVVGKVLPLPIGMPTREVRDRILAIVQDTADEIRPDIWIDAQGVGASLVELLKADQAADRYSQAINAPHAYFIGGQGSSHDIKRQQIVNKIITSVESGFLHFDPAVTGYEAAVKALQSFSLDEADAQYRDSPHAALISALGLSIYFARYGAPPRYRERSGRVVLHRSLSADPY